MSDLNWRIADVTLHTNLIPNPNAEHQLLQNIPGARVAIEGSFLHIDPQKGEPRQHGQTEWNVFIVPANAVETIRYRTTVVEPIVQIF